MADAKAIKENTNIEDALEKYGTIVWNCKGRSMKPLIRGGIDHVVIKKPDRKIRAYDVVMYARDESAPEAPGAKRENVLHRVIGRKGKDLIILGDNCVTRERVPEDRIIGIMIGLIRNGKTYDLNSAGHRLYLNLWVRPHRMRVGIIRAGSRVKRVCTKATKE